MSTAQATEILQRVQSGEVGAVDELMPIVYDEFRRLAKRFLERENKGHILQPTALVNEVYLRLVNQERVQWQGRTHFFAVGAQAMRRVLVDYARARDRKKRGGGAQRITLHEDVALSPDRDEDVLAVDEALSKLARIDERQAKIVELRFFAGLDVRQVAEVLGVSKRTVESDWTMAKAWLRRELDVPPTG